MSQTVLVVEDDADLRSLVALTLDSLGVEVRTATNGKEALAEVRSRHPALVLLDMKMPVMDGWHFVEALRASDPSPPPIVVMTAAESPAERASEVGADGWIGKPFDVDELLRCVRRYVQLQ